MKRKVWENLQYIVLLLLMIGQGVVGNDFYVGQIVYLVANIIATTRSFVLSRPAADKVKDVCCLGLTVVLILFKMA